MLIGAGWWHRFVKFRWWYRGPLVLGWFTAIQLLYAFVVCWFWFSFSFQPFDRYFSGTPGCLIFPKLPRRPLHLCFFHQPLPSPALSKTSLPATTHHQAPPQMQSPRCHTWYLQNSPHLQKKQVPEISKNIFNKYPITTAAPPPHHPTPVSSNPTASARLSAVSTLFSRHGIAHGGVHAHQVGAQKNLAETNLGKAAKVHQHRNHEKAEENTRSWHIRARSLTGDLTTSRNKNKTKI